MSARSIGPGVGAVSCYADGQVSNTSIEERLQRLEVAFGAQSELVRDLRDSFTVIGHLEARQSKLLKEHSEWLSAHESAMRDHDRRMKLVDERIDRLVSGMGEFMRRLPQ